MGGEPTIWRLRLLGVWSAALTQGLEGFLPAVNYAEGPAHQSNSIFPHDLHASHCRSAGAICTRQRTWAPILFASAYMRSILRGYLATDRVAVMGQSCGGVQAIEAASDPRVNTAMIWNSGLFPEPSAMGGGRTLDKRDLAKLHGPAAYISGDATDIAFVNANDDFRQITRIPVFRAYERGVTHGGTYFEPNGGEFAGVAVAWLLWQLQGDVHAGRLFTGAQCGLCVNPRRIVEKKRID